MNMKLLLVFITLWGTNVWAWNAKVTGILQHGGYAAIYLNPDPGVGNCEKGSPYLLLVDGTPDSNQRFSMLLTALTAGKTVTGYADECASAIWGESRPTIRRLYLSHN